MSRRLVSVIIATNRSGEFLAETLDSVAAQTYAAWEVVVVDDGSPAPDAIEAIVAGRARTRVVHQRASGVSVARNAGAAATAGEFLAFLDDDDIWDPRRLELQVEALENAPGSVASYGQVWSIDASGAQINAPDQRAARTVRDIYRRDAVPQFQSLLIRRSTFWRVGGFNPTFRYAEDLDLIFRLAREGDFTFVPSPLVGYRLHDKNVTQNPRALVMGIHRVIHNHRIVARECADRQMLLDLRAANRRNRQYAVWAAGRAAAEHWRARRVGAAVAELVWAMAFAPEAPAVAAWRRSVGRLRGAAQ
jgi:glycosyltransferase involved in cell wall biosynthesis